VSCEGVLMDEVPWIEEKDWEAAGRPCCGEGVVVIHGWPSATCACGRYLEWARISAVHVAVDDFPRDLLPPSAEDGVWTTERLEARCACGASHLAAP
jgi:hypothetical protein